MSAEDSIKEMVDFVFGHIRQILSILAFVGTVIPFFFFVFNRFGLSEFERAVLAIGIFVLLMGSAALLAIYYLFSEVERLSESTKETTLTCLAFEILSGDDGRSYDNNHVFDRIERVYDLTGERATLKTVYEGQVAIGEGSSDGIRMKYIGDYLVDGQNSNISVTRQQPLEEGADQLELRPELIDNTGPFEVILKLPFGTELEEGENFKLTMECDDLGRTPETNAPEVRVHFPLHRYRYVGRFDAEIRLPGTVSEYQAARVTHVPDQSQDRALRLEDINISYDIELREDSKPNGIHYSFQQTSEADSLYVFQFLRD